MSIRLIDTHAHLDGEEFKDDLQEVLARAKAAGVEKILVPAIDGDNVEKVLKLSQHYTGYIYPMIGLHPEEVKTDWRDVLDVMERKLSQYALPLGDDGMTGLPPCPYVAIGEVGLDYYWSREYEQEQLEAFERQVEWSVKTRLPLMIHCRKAQNEMVRLLRRYQNELPGGVFHCFTGNEHEAEELLEFDRFVLGVGGILTFKKSHLPEVLPAVVPIERIVIETDSPYMAPVPYRGQRNEPSMTVSVLEHLASAYGMEMSQVGQITTQTAENLFFVQERPDVRVKEI